MEKIDVCQKSDLHKPRASASVGAFSFVTMHASYSVQRSSPGAFPPRRGFELLYASYNSMASPRPRSEASASASSPSSADEVVKKSEAPAYRDRPNWFSVGGNRFAGEGARDLLTLCAPPERSFPRCIIWNLNRRNCLLSMVI